MSKECYSIHGLDQNRSPYFRRFWPGYGVVDLSEAKQLAIQSASHMNRFGGEMVVIRQELNTGLNLWEDREIISQEAASHV